MTIGAEEFIKYISGLVGADGETALLARQTPTLKDGQLQYHGDGVPKATFPTFYPDKAKIKDGESWYINTGSFIVDRFKDGKPSAKRENVEYVLFLMLDDIGTKSKTPPLAPTWVLETSEGSFQWGYAFNPEEQPTKGEFCAAFDAIAAAGYTDPGAGNPVRNCRLPGSINLKQGRDNFPARLVEFNRANEYTLAEICAALGVEPAEADTAEHRSIKIRDTGQDNVLAWLSDQNMVRSQVNNEGWCGIICPNEAQHSDGNPEARYKPLDRSFCCYHGHCQDLNTAAFLEWVGENGGPKVTGGLRDELLAQMHSQTLAKLTPTDAFPDEAAKIVREVERKEAGRLERNEWFERFAYVQTDDTYFDMVTRTETTRPVFNALYRHIDCRSVHNPKQKINASFYFDERRQEFGAKALAGITYAAGDDVLVARDGLLFGNRWTDARPDVSDIGTVPDHAIQLWLDHVRLLVPDDVERKHVLDAMAYKVQHPKAKINHAILHGGDEGSGKDTMWAPFLWAIGGEHQRNRTIMDAKQMESQWGYALETEVLILNELKEPEARERRAMANKLKPVIAAPPLTLTVNRKGLHPYEMVNRLMVVAFTNDKLPISIPSQDRRWFCVWSNAPRMDEDDAAAMWKWFEMGGFAKVTAWMHQRDVSAFMPAATPPMTDWKLNMVEHGMSTAESFLTDMLRARSGLFASGVIASPFHVIADAMVKKGDIPAGVKVPQAALLHALKEAGWVDIGRVATHDLSTKKQIYAHPDVAKKYGKSDMRRMVENGISDNIGQLGLATNNGNVYPMR